MDSINEKKICRKCNESKNIKEFYRNKTQCKDCQNIEKQAWVINNRDKVRQSNTKKRNKYKLYWENRDPYEENEVKLCHQCLKILSSKSFSRANSERTGLNYICKSCHHKNHEREPNKKMFYGARNRAKKKNIEFTILKEDITIPKLCPVFHIPLSLDLITSKASRGRRANIPTLDRTDNRKGYVPGNTDVISYRANSLKSDATFEEIEMLYLYLKEKRENSGSN